MNKSKALSAVILIINFIGILCLIYYAVPFLTHDTTVTNPDAMLPFENWDASGFILSLSFVPLLAANTLAFAFAAKETVKKPLRLLFFAPSAVCLCLVIIYWVYSLTMF